MDTLLRARGRTCSTLAPLLGLSQSSVSDRFRGRTPWTLADLERIADEFGVEVADLLCRRSAVA